MEVVMNTTPLSANTLFHFTNSIEHIINILTYDFTPRYCMELFDFLGEEGYQTEIAIPMVCFCDIPLSQIRNHVEHYGGYAIGLSKDWGVANAINPVMYSLPKSFSTQIIKRSMDMSKSHIDALQEIASNCEGKRCKGNKSAVEKLQTAIEEILTSHILQFNFTNYMKPYDGLAWDGNSFNGDYVKFYDEREWRYVPDPYELFHNQIKSYLSKDEFLDTDLRVESNYKVGEMSKLSFTPNDIKYIIVNREDEIIPICHQIDIIKGQRYTQDEIKLLQTRIISKDQILEDF